MFVTQILNAVAANRNTMIKTSYMYKLKLFKIYQRRNVDKKKMK